MIEISVIVPVYNSGQNLFELERQISDALQSIPHEIVLVNDFSKDSSWEIIKFLSQKNERITGINFRKNFGQDNAILAGMRHSKGEYIVIMDDDLQHSPYDITNLYENCKKGFDLCFANFRQKKHAVWKNIGSWINDKMSNWILGKHTNTYLSPFKIVHRPIVESIQFNGPFPYIDGILLQLTENISSIEVEHYKRSEGKSNYSFFGSISVFLKVLTSFSVIPLRIATVVGFSIAFIGFILGGYYVLEYITSSTVEGWTTLIVSLLILGGLMLMSIGLVGEYLGRIYLAINNKPQYSIGEIIKKPYFDKSDYPTI